MYKYDVSNDLLEIVQINEQMVWYGEIFLNPDHQSVLIVSYDELRIYSTGDINEVLLIREANNYTKSYSHSGDRLFLCESIFGGIIDKIHIYDTEIYFGFSDIDIPNIDNSTRMITNSDDSFLIAFTYNEEYNDNHFIFFLEL